MVSVEEQHIVMSGKVGRKGRGEKGGCHKEKIDKSERVNHAQTKQLQQELVREEIDHQLAKKKAKRHADEGRSGPAKNLPQAPFAFEKRKEDENE